MAMWFYNYILHLFVPLKYLDYSKGIKTLNYFISKVLNVNFMYPYAK